MKQLLAKAIAKSVKDGEVIGLGSGSTTEIALQEIAGRIASEGIQVFGVPTSYRTSLLASRAGIHVLAPEAAVPIIWAFDGADEVDPGFNMIKGRGGAMLSEKLVARRAKRLVIIVTKEKLVQKLGSQFPVPVEVLPAGLSLAEQGLKALGAREIELRPAVNKYGPEMSEQNNFILDVRFEEIRPTMEAEIKALPGVIESGLFFNFNQELLVGDSGKVFSRRLENGKIVEREVPV